MSATPTALSRRKCRTIASVAALLVFATALPAAAEPVELKLASIFPVENDTFRAGVKTFVDAVNAEGKGVVSIRVYGDGALGKRSAEQAQMVLSGVADIAWVIPGHTPYRFPDNEILELPGLFRDMREATLVYTKLVAAGMLRGYENFVVIGAFMAAPGTIHSRKPIRSLADLAGLKIRTNNPLEAEAMIKFGAIPNVVPGPMAAEALAKGAVDALVFSAAGIAQFGGPAARNHYLLPVGPAPLVVLMNRQRFDSLPDAAKALIRKYSGARAAAAWVEINGASEARALARIESDPDQKVVEPSAADREVARRIYDSMLQAYAARSPHSRQLVDMIAAELAVIRGASR